MNRTGVKGNSMYVAMNRFRIDFAREAEGEQTWRERKTFLPDALGFLNFMMLRGAELRPVLTLHSLLSDHVRKM